MAPRKVTSLQDIIRRRQQSEFVGRDNQLISFRQNLELPLEDTQRQFIINIFGQGGVGKSTLLQRFHQIAEESDAIIAALNEEQIDIPSILGQIAEQCSKQGHELKSFSERYRIYRQRRQELEADPDAPQGFSSLVGRSIVKGGLQLASTIPGGGFLDLIDKDAAATQAGEWAAFIAKKLRNNTDEIRLMQSPVEFLTPLLLNDLLKASEKKLIVLSFDTYERTGDFIDKWLIDSLEGNYGSLSPNILLIIAGREQLDRNTWSSYEGLISYMPLNPFTEEEALSYLSRKGISDIRVQEVIIRLSGRLPLLIATLAAEHPNDPNQVDDPSDTAVTRFLKWTEDNSHRKIALDAAIPQQFDQDLISLLAGEKEVVNLFEWLKNMPFVEKRSGGWVYHQVVREQMLRHKRRESISSWNLIHERLADYYKKNKNELGIKEIKRYLDVKWQDYALEEYYHRLCIIPRQRLSTALNGFLRALKARPSFAYKWADTTLKAGLDSDDADLKNWGNLLVMGLKEYSANRYAPVIDMFSLLLKYPNLEGKLRAVALNWRGHLYRGLRLYELSLNDLSRALEIAPKEPEYWTDRGETHRSMMNFASAISDFTKAIEINPDYSWAFTCRGLTYHGLRRYDEALADFDRAIDIFPRYAWAFACRAETLYAMQRYEEALSDFTKSISINPNFAWAIAGRGQTYSVLQQYENALRDFSRAMELNPNSVWIISNQVRAYQSLGRYEDALSGINRAIELQPTSSWLVSRRAEIFFALERYDDALENFTRSVEIDPQNGWAFAKRGRTYQFLNLHKEALADFVRASEINPRFAWALFTQEETREQDEVTLSALPEIQAIPPENESSYKSLNSEHPTLVKFTNLTKQIVRIYWLDFNSKRIFYYTLTPNQWYVQPTYLTHPWIVTDFEGIGLAIYLPEPEFSEIVVK